MPLSEPLPPPLDDIVAGVRVTLRQRLADGFHDVIGFVTALDAESVTVLDRHGDTHTVPRRVVVAGHRVGVARGRDPLRWPRADLDRLASRAGLTGSPFVARLCDLLDHRTPPALVAEPTGAVVEGEWLTTASRPDLVDVAWWGARHGARSLQVRASPAEAGSLLALGLTAR